MNLIIYNNVIMANNECLLCIKSYTHASFYLSQLYEIHVDICSLQEDKNFKCSRDSDSYVSPDGGKMRIGGNRMRGEVKKSHR